MKFGITSKLLVLFFMFIFIFYGTILILFVNIQKIMATSERIVNVNNQVDALSKVMLDNLLNMAANDKKYTLLKKEVYKDYFETAKKEFYDRLEKIINLDSPEHQISDKWERIRQMFDDHQTEMKLTLSGQEPVTWSDDDILENWINLIAKARRENQKEIEFSLIKINHFGKKSVSNSLIGLGVMFFAGLLGAWFISKSMIKPLKTLKNGLRNVSHDNDYKAIKIDSGDEFSELAAAFNDMTAQLKENEDLRSDFIAVLSHEIRTPLSSIQESVNMIIEQVLGPVNDQQKKFLKIAGSEIIRIRDLLDHFLDVSVLESGSQKIQPVSMDPNQLMDEVSKRLLSKEKSSNVDIRFHKLDNAPMVMGIKKHIIQVLLNIIGNAIKFSGKTSIVDVFLLNKNNSEELMFKISDKGPGVPEEEKFLIFKKYYRSKTMRKHMDGVGLGLNISQRIVHDHKGKIYMENNKGSGCSFFFTLPKTG